MIYGYARVSTKNQKIERQINNIKAAYPSVIIYKETYTGTTLDRPVWNALRQKLVKGDMVVLDEVSRLSRSAEEGSNLYEELYDLGIDMVFLKEPHINTEMFRRAVSSQITKTGTNVDLILEGIDRYMMALAREQIKLAFEKAQQEVDYLHMRTKEGIAASSKHSGRIKGRTYETQKSISSKKIIRKKSRRFSGTLNDQECIKVIGITPNSFYKYVNQMFDEMSHGETSEEG